MRILKMQVWWNWWEGFLSSDAAPPSAHCRAGSLISFLWTTVLKNVWFLFCSCMFGVKALTRCCMLNVNLFFHFHLHCRCTMPTLDSISHFHCTNFFLSVFGTSGGSCLHHRVDSLRLVPLKIYLFLFLPDFKCLAKGVALFFTSLIKTTFRRN